MIHRSAASLTVLWLLICGAVTRAEPLEFREQELAERLGVGYAVRLLDMNQDERLDIVIVDQQRILWLENPNWNTHLLIQGQTVPDNVCFAPSDIDRDGRLDFAVGADWRFSDTKAGGTIQWITRPADGGAASGGLWNVHAIGEEPTVHRMQFADLDGDGAEELLVLPLLGRNSTPPHFQEQGVRLLRYVVPEDPVAHPWTAEVVTDELHVTHNLFPTDLDGNGTMDLLVASFEGITWIQRKPNGHWQLTRVGTGNQESSPSRGASEIKRGHLSDGRDYLATIEPWHGFQVVVYHRPQEPPQDAAEWLWTRQVLDEQLKWGHAVWCANLDDDEDEELIIGVRDDLDDLSRRGVRIYDPPAQPGQPWQRTVLDPGSVAVEDLAAGDLNGDGRVDIVAVGRQTHNVKIYWNATGQESRP